MLTERGARLLVNLGSNVGAIVFGILGAWATGFGLWGIAVAPISGTIGWFLGWFAARSLGRRLTQAGYAPPGQPVYRLGSVPRTELSAGGKALSLSALIRAGQRVPAGLVVLPRGFTHTGITDDARSMVEAEIRRLRPGSRFAVRSSATTEDSATASFAGAYESILDVAADEVYEAIDRVRASAGDTRVTAYTEATGVGAGEIAVVVQEMVPAHYAGVLFTVDPLSGALDTMVGTAVAGLGEAVVSGEQTGEQFRLSRPSGEYTGPATLQQHAKTLHAQAHRIEGTFGGVPQDIEWAIVDKDVWILQARPITTLNPWNPRTAELNDTLAGTCLWSATNLSESNPEAQTPLTASLVRYQQAYGGPSMALRGREMAGYVGGRPYANLTVQITARRGKAAKIEPRDAYRKLAGWWGDLPPRVPIPLLPMTASDWTEAGIPLLGSLVRMGWTRLRLPTFLQSHQADCADLNRRIDGCTQPNDLRRLWDEELRQFGIDSFWAVVASGSTYPATVELRLREQYGDEAAAALMSNLSGLVDSLESLGPATGLREVKAGRMRREDYLAQFGHRGVNEVELAWPHPSEDPQWLDRMLADVDDLDSVTDLRLRQRQAYDAAMSQLARSNPRAAKRVARELLRAARQAALREAVRSEGVRTTGVFRRFALKAGELLGLGEDVFMLTVDELLAALDGDTTAWGYLPDRRALYDTYRGLPSLPAVIVGRFDPVAWAADPDRNPAVFIAGEDAAPPLSQDADAIIGHAGAAGRVEGRVRRIDRFADAAELQPGEILVTPVTNIGWTPLFPRAAAIVTDLGAPLSHAAIVARELGIPAVVGCGDATTRLHTGDLVEVDGAAGRVTVLTRNDGELLPEHPPRAASGSVAPEI
ncbi:MAG TPA: PEP/pyruvate-binding domain-containing protein [Propionicimonas sp.]|nr:PEP/pyruvate-binding domain-containing protein [Propionicimonas sp.]